MKRFGSSLFTLLALACPALVSAQAATVTGRVTTEGGAPLSGASVTVAGVVGIARADGAYSVIVPGGRFTPGATLDATAQMIGYATTTSQVRLTAGGNVQLNFVLPPDPLRLSEIVVTGAGTTALAERLGTQRASVDAVEIIRANEPNIVQALAGKVPNVITNQQSGDAGSSTAIQIRGTKTITGTSQPLIVVDGVPINNATRITGSGDARSVNATVLAGAVSPNRASDINPDDIASIEVLKGAAATSIYGAAAGSAGAILITTKRGRAGQTRFTLRSTLQADEPVQFLPTQKRFGVGTGGVSTQCTTVNCTIAAGFFSWGPELSSGTPTYDHAREIYETGRVWDNTLSMSGGNERTTFYLSASSLDHNGFIYSDNDYFKRQSFRFNGSHGVTDELTVGASGSYVQTRGNGIGRGNALSGILGALRQPPEFNALQYLDPVSGLHRSWRFPNPGPTAFTNNRGFDNPFYAIAESKNMAETGRFFGNLNLSYNPLTWLTLNYTLGADYTSDDRTEAYPVSASGAQAGGQLERWQFYDRIIDHNLTATAEFDLTPSITGSVTAGQNLNEQYFRQVDVFARTWIAPTPFKLQNTVSREPPADAESRRRIEGYFAQATFDIAEQLFLSARVRNDGNSAFSAENQRAWYPGGSIAWSFTNRFNPAPSILSFGKLRFAYGETGQEPPLYTTQDIFVNDARADFNPGSTLITTLNGIGGLYASSTKGNTTIKPERVRELEYGFDLSLFNARADVGLTRYDSKSTDVVLPVSTAPSTGYTTAWVNAAEIENKGWEATANVRVLESTNVRIELGTSWAMNRNQVLSLGNPAATPEACGDLALLPRCEFGTFALVSGGAFGGQTTHAQVGYPFGVWRGTDFARCGRGLTTLGVNNIAQACQGAPDGALYIAANGYPIQDTNSRVVGSPEADWTAGFSANVNIRGVEISAFVDHRQGGETLNMTRASMYQYGTHGDTDQRGQNRTFGTDWLCQNKTCEIFNGPVVGPGAGMAVPLNETWFTGLASVGGPTTNRIEDATNTRLREISVGYTFRGAWVQRIGGIEALDVKVSGRNLGLWTDYSGYDPETNIGGAAAVNRGIDWFNNPLARAWVISVGLTR
jgi:TonB-linked SusC/RagA family outer membrane protein